ncbi:MAG: DNA-directed RNA polymerase [Candidatus Woesearchaeota archaeon]
MFYKVQIKDHIRLPPKLFDMPLEEAITDRIRKKYEGYISEELGISIDVANISNIGQGTIISGDGAPYYDTEFELLTFKPEMQEVTLGKIKDVADFGVFITLGPIEGMIHISQTMDDFVSFSKDKTLAGKESKKTLKVEDMCRARIIAVSFKDLSNPKIGLTMRQPSLGRLDWIEEEQSPNKGKDDKKKDDKETKEKKGKKDKKK